MDDRLRYFSAAARMTLHCAQEEAVRLGRDYIDIEHLLLGILRLPDSRAGRALRAIGVSLTAARELAKERRGGLIGIPQSGFSHAAATSLESAFYAANLSPNEYREVSTEHILRALLNSEDGIVRTILHTLGVHDYERLFEELHSLEEDFDAPRDLGSPDLGPWDMETIDGRRTRDTIWLSRPVTVMEFADLLGLPVAPVAKAFLARGFYVGVSERPHLAALSLVAGDFGRTIQYG